MYDFNLTEEEERKVFLEMVRCQSQWLYLCKTEEEKFLKASEILILLFYVSSKEEIDNFTLMPKEFIENFHGLEKEDIENCAKRLLERGR